MLRLFFFAITYLGIASSALLRIALLAKTFQTIIARRRLGLRTKQSPSLNGKY